MTKLVNMTDRLAMMIENLVDYLGTSQGCNGRQLSYYDGALPFLPDVMNETDPLAGPEQGIPASISDPTISDETASYELGEMFRRYPTSGTDFTWISMIHGSSAKWKWAIQRIRSVSPKQARGCRIVAPQMLRRQIAMVRTDATYQEEAQHLAYLGGAWRWAGERSRVEKVKREAERDAGLGIWLAERTKPSWQVLLGYTDSPRLRFETDPSGVLSCFRLRDIPNGKSRRSALVHWVSSHWRKSSSREGLAEVRAHLRGARRFLWNGLDCEILPKEDPHDIEI